MANYQLLISSNQNLSIIISDEIIYEDDNIIRLSTNEISVANDEWGSGDVDDDWKKIIAGVGKLPKIDYNGFENVVGYIDAIQIAEDIVTSHPDYQTEGKSDYQNGKFNGIIEGIEYISTHNNNLYTLQDIHKGVNELFGWFATNRNSTIVVKDKLNDIFKNISNKTKIFDIELEMVEGTASALLGGYVPYPKVSKDNKIKIINVL